MGSAGLIHSTAADGGMGMAMVAAPGGFGLMLSSVPLANSG